MANFVGGVPIIEMIECVEGFTFKLNPEDAGSKWSISPECGDDKRLKRPLSKVTLTRPKFFPQVVNNTREVQKGRFDAELKVSILRGWS